MCWRRITSPTVCVLLVSALWTRGMGNGGLAVCYDTLCCFDVLRKEARMGQLGCQNRRKSDITYQHRREVLMGENMAYQNHISFVCIWGTRTT